MNKKGFVFIETIITVVVLSASLIIIYSSYSNAMYDEQTRLYYNDPAYLYRTYYIREFLMVNSNIEGIKDYVFDNVYITTIGTNFDTMFTEEQNTKNMRKSLEILYENFNINQMLLVDGTEAQKCIKDELNECENTHSSLNVNMGRFVRTLNFEPGEYYLIVEYAEKEIIDSKARKITKCTPSIDTSCTSYFVVLTI